MKQKVSVGQKIELEIKRMGINGEGIGYHDKLAVFVDDALPEEIILAELTEVHDNRAVAHMLKILTTSPDRITPFCPVYQQCGGCQTQHLDYDKSLEFKRDILLKAFNRYAEIRVPGYKVKSTIGAENQTHYRNKASLPIQKIHGKNRFGMYQKNSNLMIPIDGCPIQHDMINHVYRNLVALLDIHGIDGIDPKTKKGDIRHVVIRRTEFKQEIQVSLIMTHDHPKLKGLVDDLILKVPAITSVFEVINSDLKEVQLFSGKLKLLYGKPLIEEELHGHTYLLKPEAFFQLNTRQADLFYQTMKRLAKLNKGDVAIDAYAGIAPVSHYLSEDAKHIYAIESDPSSCDSARLSLKKNNILNVTVIQTDFKKALTQLKDPQVDVMFFNPPRTGLGPDTIDLILNARPRKIIYGSCNPSTLAKDFAVLFRAYNLVETVPIDMFPYTSLVESVSLLHKK